MVSIELFPVCQKAWQSRDTLSQFGARLCGTIACIGSEWHGTGVPTWSSSYSNLPFSSWQALESNKLFLLHTGFFIDAYGRLMKVVRCTKAVSEGAPSLHRVSLATPALTVKWWTNHKVFSNEFIFGDVPCMSGLLFFLVPVLSHWWQRVDVLSEWGIHTTAGMRCCITQNATRLSELSGYSGLRDVGFYTKNPFVICTSLDTCKFILIDGFQTHQLYWYLYNTKNRDLYSSGSK